MGPCYNHLTAGNEGPGKEILVQLEAHGHTEHVMLFQVCPVRSVVKFLICDTLAVLLREFPREAILQFRHVWSIVLFASVPRFLGIHQLLTV